MKQHIVYTGIMVTALWLSLPLAEPVHNTLTPAEVAAGWVLLFDGTDKDTHWQVGMDGGAGSNNWIIDGDAMTPAPGSGGSELYIIRPYDNFEFSMDWKINEGGNSGVWYRATDQPSRICSAHEYSILDGDVHPDKDAMGHLEGEETWPIKRSGANYDLYPTTLDGAGEEYVEIDNSIGEYNNTVIWANGKLVEHWLNYQKVVDYDTDSQEWLDRYHLSKYYLDIKSCSDAHDTWGRHPSGFIGIQDHGHGLLVWVKNLKIRPFTPGEKLVTPLSSPAAGTFDSPLTITLEAAVTGAKIYYTMDGTDPQVTPEHLYEGPFPLAASAVIKAVTVRETFATSDVMTSEYTLPTGINDRPVSPGTHFECDLIGNQLQVQSMHRGPGGFKLKLFDHQGLRVLSKRSDKPHAVFDLGHLVSGVYIAQIEPAGALGQRGIAYQKLFLIRND